MSKETSPCLFHNLFFLVSPQHHSLGCSGCVCLGRRSGRNLSSLIPFSHTPHPIHLHIMVAQIFKMYSEWTSSHHLHHYHSSPNSQSLILLYLLLPGFPPSTLPWSHIQQPVWSPKNVVSCHLLLKIPRRLLLSSECNTKSSSWRIRSFMVWPCASLFSTIFSLRLLQLYWLRWRSVSRSNILLEVIGYLHLLFPDYNTLLQISPCVTHFT